MVPSSALARHRAYLRQNPRGPLGAAGLREYCRYISGGSKRAGSPSGAYDAASKRRAASPTVTGNAS